jgi:mRNA-degrading endonuclease toxin of MazEF toxin-antitoxin module
VGRFQFGQVILAYMQDGRGRTKERPALIISRDEENDRGEDLQVIAITTQIEDPCPPYHVVLVGKSETNRGAVLSKPCVAKCNWVRDVKQNKVIRSLGFLDLDLLTEIVDQFNKLYEDDTFDCWT